MVAAMPTWFPVEPKQHYGIIYSLNQLMETTQKVRVIEKFLLRTFKCTHHEVYESGNVVFVSMTYKDSYPIQQARTIIENLNQGIVVNEIYRNYSDRARLAVLNKLIEDDATFYQLTPDGEYQEVTMNQIVEQYLYNKRIII